MSLKIIKYLNLFFINPLIKILKILTITNVKREKNYKRSNIKQSRITDPIQRPCRKPWFRLTTVFQLGDC